MLNRSSLLKKTSLFFEFQKTFIRFKKNKNKREPYF